MFLHQNADIAYLFQSAFRMQAHLRENRTVTFHARNIKIGLGNSQQKDENKSLVKKAETGI